MKCHKSRIIKPYKNGLASGNPRIMTACAGDRQMGALRRAYLFPHAALSPQRKRHTE